MEKDNIPQYVRIAIALGKEIASGEYKEGTKMPGLSKLASLYGVSTETVRKSMQLLADMNIILLCEKKNAVVLSAERAEYYLESLKYRKERYELSDKMRGLFRSYQEIGKELEEVSSRLLDSLAYPMPSEQMIPTFEVLVSGDSDKVGRTVGSLKFWQATGSTIIAIRRGQSIIVSPGPYEKFNDGDVIVCVGNPGCESIVDYYINSPIGEVQKSQDDYHSLWAENINESLYEEREKIQRNICDFLKCSPSDISHIMPMEQGLNNHSFSFMCKQDKYVYRHPGVNSVDVINREKESIALKTAKRLGIDDTLLYIDESTGWKLSRFVTVTEEFSFSNKKHIRMLASHLKNLNESEEKLGFEFDYEKEANRLIDTIKKENSRKYRMAVKTRDFVKSAFDILRLDPWKTGLCHNDLYEPNLLVEGDKLHIIDWEFAGDSDIGFDICKVFASITPKYEELDEWLSLYYERPISTDEKYHLIACAAVLYYYWYIWGLYADENGENVADYITLWRDRMIYYINMIKSV